MNSRKYKKYYNYAKYVLQILIPALVALIAGLGAVYEFQTDKIIMTMTLLSTFGGTCLGISDANYKQKKLITKEIQDYDKQIKD